MNKDTWIKELKVGDRVCDCRYEHMTIKGITDDTAVWRSRSYWWFIDLFPDHIGDWIDDTWESIGRGLGLVSLMDRTLILEDGSQCSATHCCDPVDHDWEHILKSEYKEHGS